MLFEELESPVRQAAAQVLRKSPKRILEPLDALQQIGGLASDVHANLSIDHRADDLISILLESQNDPKRLKAAFDAITTGRPPTPVTHLLIDSALRFVLAHEAGHHLLNHTQRAASSNAAPGAAFLFEHCERVGLSPLSPTLSRPHRQELAADALGFLLSCGDLWGDATDSYFRSLIPVAGSFIALPSLSLIDEGGPDAVSRTHPSLMARCARLGELAFRFCPPNPAPPTMEPTLGREIRGDPVSAGLQLWLVIGVIAQRMDELSRR